MRKATHLVAASFGFMAGIAGLEHGYFEILHGTALRCSQNLECLRTRHDPSAQPAGSRCFDGPAWPIDHGLVGWFCARQKWRPDIDPSFGGPAPGWWWFFPTPDRDCWRRGWDADQQAVGRETRNYHSFCLQVVALATDYFYQLAFGTIPGGLFLQRYSEKHHGFWPDLDSSVFAALGLHWLRQRRG